MPAKKETARFRVEAGHRFRSTSDFRQSVGLPPPAQRALCGHGADNRLDRYGIRALLRARDRRPWRPAWGSSFSPNQRGFKSEATTNEAGRNRSIAMSLPPAPTVHAPLEATGAGRADFGPWRGPAWQARLRGPFKSKPPRAWAKGGFLKNVCGQIVAAGSSSFLSSIICSGYLVEAGGIEPPSENAPLLASTGLDRKTISPRAGLSAGPPPASPSIVSCLPQRTRVRASLMGFGVPVQHIRRQLMER